MTEYRHHDTAKADGFYVEFTRKVTCDYDANPQDYLFQDDDYRDEDQARLDAFNAGDWGFIGVQAVAHCTLVRNGVATSYTMTSPGCWGIEDDSGEDYLSEVHADEIAVLKADILAMSSPVFAE